MEKSQMLWKTQISEMTSLPPWLVSKRVCVAAMLVLAFCAGCQSHAQSRKAAKERWNKTSAQIKLALAQQQYDNGKYEHAGKVITQCIAADPQLPRAHLLLAKLLLAQDKHEAASGRLRTAVELDEELHEAWYWLGVAAQQDRSYQQAYQHYQKALSLEPTNIDYILAVVDSQIAQKNYSEAVELLTEKMLALPSDVSLKVAAADLYSRIEKYEQAVGLYKQAMLITGNDTDIAEALGYCYLFSGRWQEAAEIFNKLIEQCPDEPRKSFYLEVAALCSMHCAQYDRAVDCYSKLAVEKKDNAEIWVKMGQAALGAGMTSQALICGQRALELKPGYADAVLLVGCTRYADGQHEAAAEDFEKILTDGKNGPLSWLMMARCYEQLGQMDKARRAYKRALEISPDSELGHFLAKSVEPGS